MCDPTCDLVSDLKSDLQQIRQQREKIFNEQNDFFNRFYADHFTFQPDAYQINISDSEEEEEPTRIRIMTMRYQTLFEQKPKKKKEKPLPEVVPLPPPVITKPLCIDRSTQAKKIEFRTLETQTSIKSTYVDTATVATTSAEVQTHAIRLRCEATNTDSVLPSYENVCIAFLESLLEDAPVFINSGPKPEQLEGILMDFLNQLIRDAKNFDNNQLDSSGNSQNGQSILSNGPLLKKAKLVDANIQQEIPVQTIATQSPISLKVLETPTRIFNYIPPPEQPRNFLVVDSSSLVTYSIAGDATPSKSKEDDYFSYPPSLRIEPERRHIRMIIEPTMNKEFVRKDDDEVIKPILSDMQTGPEKPEDNKENVATPKKQQSTKLIQTEVARKMLQTEILEAENVSVEPKQNIQNLPILSFPSQPQPQPQSQPQPQPQPSHPPILPSKQSKVPILNELKINKLEEIEDLSEFNIDNLLKDLDSSSSENDDDIASGYSNYSYYTEPLNDSTISKALNSSTVSTNLSVSGVDSGSEGEFREPSYIESNDSFESDI